MTPGVERGVGAIRAVLDCAADFEIRASPELLADARAALLDIEALLRECREVIDKCEWAVALYPCGQCAESDDQTRELCPLCGEDFHTAPSHKADCRLAATLKKLAEAVP